MAFAKDVSWDSQLVKENSQLAKEKLARENHQDSRKAASKYDFVKVRNRQVQLSHASSDMQSGSEPHRSCIPGQSLARGRPGALLRPVALPGQPQPDGHQDPAHEGGQNRAGAEEVLRGQRPAGHSPGEFTSDWLSLNLCFRATVSSMSRIRLDAAPMAPVHQSCQQHCRST